jgi:DNA segregation ATPase FtsK/SpoIIIE-like protein
LKALLKCDEDSNLAQIVQHKGAVVDILSWEPGGAPAKPARKRRKDFGTKRATNEKPSSDLIDQCSAAVIAEQKASVSLIQRRFSVGYQKAVSIMAELERRGVVGPVKGSQPRAILQAGTPVSAPPSCDSLAKPHWEKCVLVAASSKYAGK